MNSSYFNAAAGALLAVLFVVMTISIASDAIFHTTPPEAEGYAIAPLEGSAGPAVGAEEEGLPPIAPLLASADVAGGQSAFRKCAACHTVENGGANRVGPNLWNIVDRPIAAADGFGYSSSMREFAQDGNEVWDYDHLNEFLAAPKKYIRGTAMGFAGLKKEQERADVIAYLRSLSDSPAPLPDPTAATEEPTEEASAASSGDEATASDEGAAADTGDGAAPESDASDESAPASDATSTDDSKSE